MPDGDAGSCYLGDFDGGVPPQQKRDEYMVAFSPAIIIGNLTADPKLTYTDGGAALLKFGVASNHYYRDKNDEKQEKTSFFDVTCWRYLAEDSASVLEKGVGVIVQGRLEQRSWEADDGTKRSKIELIADHVGVLTRSIEDFTRKRRGQGGEGQTAAASPRAKQSEPALEKDPF
jgi:single-strand DNA-binding protein